MSLNISKKQNLSERELSILSSEMDKRKKSNVITWLLWLFFGGLGAHRYYLGRYGTAIIMTLTLGLFGIWTIIDLFLINGMIRKENEKIETDIINELKG